MFRRILSIVAVAALCSFASASSIDMSDSASLADLLSGAETLSLGDIEISNFEADETTFLNGGAVQPIVPSSVQVEANLVCGNKIELSFGAVAFAAGGAVYDYILEFDVSTGGAPIMSSTLTQIGGGPNLATTNITETILYTGGGAGLNTDDGTITSTTALPNPSDIHVVKDILLFSTATDSAQISRFSQTYMIPEPSSLGLGVFGMIGGLGMTRRRRRR